ncbi:hypothetical protein [Spirosoma spitsbergense]|uniref:hypothetical protein n=1 Tax=Spirosoma spitsbergense TaxID=431554 RepID=UPI0012FB8C0E|nr:hypothetical protein [Spirosoma spitsbergense]
MLKSAYQSDFYYSVRVAKPDVPSLLHNHVQEWKQHYRQLNQAMQAIDDEDQTRLPQQPALRLLQPPISQEHRMTALLEHSIRERQQRERSQQYIYT